MATLYESLLPEVIPMVPGCPDTLIENNIRAATIELCEKAAVLQAELDALTTIAGAFEYDLEPPTDTVVHKIMFVVHDGVELEPVTTSLLEQRKRNWREAQYRGTPEYYVKASRSLIWLVPVPDVTQPLSTIIRCHLKPTQTSLSADDELMSDYRDTIVNGALFRLLRLPSKQWTDPAGAQVYGSLFNAGVIEADRRARNADAGVVRKVSYGGIHTPFSKRRNRYGSGG
jgi:hypothetical protein